MDDKTKMLCAFCCTEHDENEPGSASVYSYYVCPRCAAAMKEGITIIVAEPEPTETDQLPICVLTDKNSKDMPLYPTGEWSVFTPDAMRALFAPEYAEKAIENRVALASGEIMSGVKKIYKNTMMPAPIKTDNPADMTPDQYDGETGANSEVKTE